MLNCWFAILMYKEFKNKRVKWSESQLSAKRGSFVRNLSKVYNTKFSDFFLLRLSCTSSQQHPKTRAKTTRDRAPRANSPMTMAPPSAHGSCCSRYRNHSTQSSGDGVGFIWSDNLSSAMSCWWICSQLGDFRRAPTHHRAAFSVCFWSTGSPGVMKTFSYSYS